MYMENNFHKPTRQSYVAIILILYKVYMTFVKQFWYLVIPFIIGKKSNSSYILYGVIVIAILLAIYSIINFFKYKFYISGNDLIVEKGVFSKKRIVIPFDRIQSINFKQNLIQQIFSVVGLEIDTAGAAKKEFDFYALDKRTSKSLRDYIFANKKSAIKGDENKKEELKNFHTPVQNIVKLDIIELIKIGLTQNHFRSLFLALFSMFWLAEQVKNIGIDIDKYTEITEENFMKLGIFIITGVVIISIIIVIIVSVVRNVFKYYNLVLNRIPKGFKLEYGLFNRNEISVMDNKMQVLKWSDNLLRRALGLFNLQIHLASSIAIKQKKSIVIPGVKLNDIDRIKEFYFPNESSKLTEFFKVDIYYLKRRIAIVLGFFVVIVFSILLFYKITEEQIEDPFQLLSILTVMFLYFLFTSYLKYNKMKYSLNNEVIQINSGIFGNKNSLYTIYKLQGVKITQTPIQKRKGLSNIVFYSSAGSDKIKYIPISEAEQLRDYLLYMIESDNREWM